MKRTGELRCVESNEEDVDALDSYLKQFAPKGDNPAEGNEKVASLVNAYNAITIRTILGAYPVESIHEGISGRVLRFKRVGAVKPRKNLAHLRVLHSQLSSKVPSLPPAEAASSPGSTTEMSAASVAPETPPPPEPSQNLTPEQKCFQRCTRPTRTQIKSTHRKRRSLFTLADGRRLYRSRQLRRYDGIGGDGSEGSRKDAAVIPLALAALTSEKNT